MTTSAVAPPVETIAPGLQTRAPDGALGGARTILLGLGVVALGASAVGWFTDQKQFYFSWLVSFMFVLSLALGAMFFVLIQHLTRAGWSVVVRRVAENMMGAMPLMVLLFVPIGIGFATLYEHWVHAEHINPGEAGFDEILYGKRKYLNTPFFFVRVVLYFVIWLGITAWFRGQSLKQDQSGDPAITQRMARVGAPCMFLFAVSLTFAAVDWMMSLDPHWFSTIWGVYYFAGSFMALNASLALLLLWMRGRGLLTAAVSTEHYHDVGKLMFAFVVFWTYIAFSQYMLIWYANLPEETWWYQHHLEGSWGAVGEWLMLGHFGIPFVFLMSRHIKRSRFTLGMGAVFLLGMHWIDLHWIVMPTLHREGLHLSWLDFSTLIGMVALFFWMVLGHLQRHPLIPERDPRLPESLHFVNH
ncbi:MAG: hypothetical protein AAF628_06575 [Planctomycetota bacterium]